MNYELDKTISWRSKSNSAKWQTEKKLTIYIHFLTLLVSYFKHIYFIFFLLFDIELNEEWTRVFETKPGVNVESLAAKTSQLPSILLEIGTIKSNTMPTNHKTTE